MTYKGWYALKPKQPTNQTNNQPKNLEATLFFEDFSKAFDSIHKYIVSPNKRLKL